MRRVGAHTPRISCHRSRLLLPAHTCQKTGTEVKGSRDGSLGLGKETFWEALGREAILGLTLMGDWDGVK